MSSIEVELVKAFTQNPAEGNPAGVVLNADALSAEVMTQIAAALGYSESAFVSASTSADFRVRFFTPTEETKLCAHGTLAAIHALKIFGPVHQETAAGILEVDVKEDGLIVMTQTEPEFSPYEADRTQVAQLLGLNPQDLTDWPLQIVSTGTPKLLIPLTSLEVLRAIQPDLEGIKSFCRESGAKGFYPFTLGADFHARQFNPLAGINEDPITGVAAGALGAYLIKHQLLGKNTFIVEQGENLGKPGKIFVDTTDKIKVGGYAVSFGKTTIEI